MGPKNPPCILDQFKQLQINVRENMIVEKSAKIEANSRPLQMTTVGMHSGRNEKRLNSNSAFYRITLKWKRK